LLMKYKVKLWTSPALTIEADSEQEAIRRAAHELHVDLTDFEADALEIDDNEIA
jgi:hypothetical protein